MNYDNKSNYLGTNIYSGSNYMDVINLSTDLVSGIQFRILDNNLILSKHIYTVTHISIHNKFWSGKLSTIIYFNSIENEIPSHGDLMRQF